jgi:hypothetical protein
MLRYRGTNLKYATFLPGDLTNCLSQNTDVVYTQGRYSCNNGPRNYVGTIIGATYTDFYYSCIDLDRWSSSNSNSLWQ